MYKIVSYINEKGDSPLYDYLKELLEKDTKSSRIILKKIIDNIYILKDMGLSAGRPYIKSLLGYDNLYKLHVIRDRLFFTTYNGDTFVFLNYFHKNTQKTPIKQKKIANRMMNDFKENHKYQDIDEFLIFLKEKINH